MAKPIKDLKDLSVLRVSECYRHSGPTDLKRIRDVFSVVRTMARDRPSPYGDVPFFSRSVGALGCHTRSRAGFTRERWSARTRAMARDRPSPYGNARRFFPYRGAPRMPHAHPRGFPPRALECADDIETSRARHSRKKIVDTHCNFG